ncbi:D-glycero-alpha-D-manno-heptose-1,7-bisphosphate 7-phosphatase [Limimaricola cinnabarinus]|uniref:D-glycero-alpha-D-manno-heptose-1,7-bisphosphate 7-phosphatase n=1 Tax=Limimaricola cinnabarinus TaxID=1125964 RepID=UPI0009DB7822|nr:HAD family hydrolase [Limimaricola cinnabarinus]
MSGARPALFLDRDGIINVDHGYVATRERLDYVPGIADLVAAANRAGWAVVIVTNQSGVARGYFPESQMHAFHDMIRADLASQGARIDAVYHCPHLPGAAVAQFDVDCDCRKPRPGMLLRAIREMDLDPARSAMIGDKPSDVEAARARVSQAICFRAATCWSSPPRACRRFRSRGCRAASRHSRPRPLRESASSAPARPRRRARCGLR